MINPEEAREVLRTIEYDIQGMRSTGNVALSDRSGLRLESLEASRKFAQAVRDKADCYLKATELPFKAP